MSTSADPLQAPLLKNLDTNDHKKALLSALAEFIRPLICAYSRPTEVAQNCPQNDSVIQDPGSFDDPQSKELVFALERFITAQMGGTRHPMANMEATPATATATSEPVIDGRNYTGDIDAPTTEGDYQEELELNDTFMTSQIPEQRVDVPSRLPTQLPMTDLESEILTMVRAHVYNKMPIRMLAFDSNGGNIELIERGGIFSIILSMVKKEVGTPDFQELCRVAEKLDDDQSRLSKLSRLIKRVIDRSARYAILSHTWIRTAPGDVIYTHWSKRRDSPPGYAKVANFCKVAAETLGVTLGWIDSACINKDSSSELDESIRSMYSWYRGSAACITFLAETESIRNAPNDSWFTRGWTLQELLAPRETHFYSKTWKLLGSTKDKDIIAMIGARLAITKQELYLFRIGNVDHVPLSRRMQLACGRQVTREEDASYSLMGILGVAIPIAYGEGTKSAFYRLVREILATKKDVMDLFNRGYDRSNRFISPSLDLYSQRRDLFDSGNDRGGSTLNQFQPIEPILLTHLGVRMPFLLFPSLRRSGQTKRPYTPLGDFSGTYTIDLTATEPATGNVIYEFLHSLIYTDDIPSNIEHHEQQFEPIVMYGVINFGSDSNGDILLPLSCAALRLHWDGIAFGKLTPSPDVRIYPGRLRQFELKSATGNYSIPRNQLVDHGMQLITLYL